MQRSFVSCTALDEISQLSLHGQDHEQTVRKGDENVVAYSLSDQISSRQGPRKALMSFSNILTYDQEETISFCGRLAATVLH